MTVLPKIRRILRDDETHLVDLTRHFFNRFFDIEFISKDAEAHLGVAHILALLAIPGALYAIFSLPSYSYIYWHFTQARYDALSLSDQCLYVFTSMSVIGMVAVLEWDRLFPDRWDYAILMPLPLKLQSIFCAKIVALLLFVGLFVVAAGGLPILFYPLISSWAFPLEVPFKNFVWMMAVHGIAIFSGCVFMFLFFVALQGVLINLLSDSLSRKISVYVQGLAAIALICLFFLSPLVPDLLLTWGRSDRRLLLALPPMWFLGLYRTLLGYHDAFFNQLARVAVLGLALSAVMAAAAYLVCYRGHSRMSFEAAEDRRPSRFGLRSLASRLLDRLWLEEGPERGAFYFVLITLGRNGKHRLYFVAYVAVGLAVALMGILELMVHSARGGLWATIGRPNEALLSIPLIISFFTLVGMRAAFGFPAELRANWIFQITEENSGTRCLAGARKAMIALAIVPIFMSTLIVYALLWDLMTSLLTVVFGILLSLILMELLLCTFRKIPFTCSHLPGKANLPLMGAIYWLVFALYAYLMASLEKWILHQPLAWIAVFGMELVLLSRVVTYRKSTLADGLGVEYEDLPVSTVLTLDLNA